MSNTLLIGKDLPDGLGFAEVLADSGRSVFGTAKSEADAAKFESEKIYATTWNKASAVSAHSVIIQAETKLESFDEVVFYFDAASFCTQFELDRTEDLSNGIDSMVSSVRKKLLFYSLSKNILQNTKCFLLKLRVLFRQALL